MHSAFITKIEHCLDLHAFLHAHFPHDPASNDGWAIHHVAVVTCKDDECDFLTSDDLRQRFGFADDHIADFFEIHHWLYQRHQTQYGCPCAWRIDNKTFVGEKIRYPVDFLAQAILDDPNHWHSFDELEAKFYQ